MAKTQFNCRLDESVIEWIDEEAARRSEALGRKFSQADVVTMLVGSASMMSAKPRKKLSKKEQLAEARKASDPLAQAMERKDVDYMNPDELPSAGSVGVEVVNSTTSRVKAGDRFTVEDTTVADWRANRKPLLKPKERSK